MLHWDEMTARVGLPLASPTCTATPIYVVSQRARTHARTHAQGTASEQHRDSGCLLGGWVVRIYVDTAAANHQVAMALDVWPGGGVCDCELE